MGFVWVPANNDPQNPLDNTVGYWRNDEWSPGEPGLLAFIVGVSDYPHMQTNAQWPTYGFETPLYVSALSAYRLFECVTTLSWIRHPGAKVARYGCTSLLPPMRQPANRQSVRASTEQPISQRSGKG
jgi:hypothetical protein